MREAVYQNREHDPRIHYRGENPSRLDNLTDGVFGIAITLLIFNLSNPNSFEDLITFTKTLPAFLISIGFLVMICKEHLRFSEIYTLQDIVLVIYNTLFIALIIFYVYPLRFLTLFLTNFFFDTNIDVRIKGSQVPELMIYYGFIAFALYFILFLFYHRAHQLRDKIKLNEFEVLYTRLQRKRFILMFAIPLLSIVATFILSLFSFVLASIIGGVIYNLYFPAMMIWRKQFDRATKGFTIEQPKQH